MRVAGEYFFVTYGESSEAGVYCMPVHGLCLGTGGAAQRKDQGAGT
jgi:hypothetical protein